MDGPIQKLFFWELKLGIAPVLVASVYEHQVRLRLIGVNPKYYSLFYVKEGGYLDLTTLQLHEYAHQIDPNPIQWQHYLSCSEG